MPFTLVKEGQERDNMSIKRLFTEKKMDVSLWYV
jgi:hypothetical protein